MCIELHNSWRILSHLQIGLDQAGLVIKCKTGKKVFENWSTLKMTKLAQRKKISVSTVSRTVKKLGVRILKHLKKALLVDLIIPKCLERNTHLLDNFKFHGNWSLIFSVEKIFTLNPVFNKKNDCVVGSWKDFSDVWNHCIKRRICNYKNILEKLPEIQITRLNKMALA